MALTAAATGAPKLCYSRSSYHQLLKHPKLMVSTKLFLNVANQSSNMRLKGFFPIQASNSQSEEESSTMNGRNGISKEDLNFLWKLGTGSIAAAAVIKYGSILFPEITRPNILQALIMISTPVIVAIVLLSKQSRSE